MKKTNTRYVVNSTLWMLFEKVTNIFFGVAVSVIVARALGPNDFGVFSMLVSISLMLTFLVSLGADGLIVKKTIDGQFTKSLYPTFLLIKLCGFIIYLAFFIAISSLIGSTSPLFVGSIAFSVFFKIWLFFRYYFEAQKDFYRASIGVISSRFAAIGFIFVLFLLDFNKDYLVLYLVVDSMISSAVYYVLFQKRQALLRPKLIEVKKLTKEIVPYALAAAIFPIFMQVDVVMIGILSGEAEAGFYSAANQMVAPFSFVGFIIISVLFPIIVVTRNKEKIERMVSGAAQVIIILSYLFVCFIFLFGDFAIDVLYGNAYEESKSILKILSFVSIFAFAASIYARMLVFEDYARFNLYKSVIGMIVNVGLNAFLIPRYGAFGAAFASIVAYALSDFILYFVDKKVRYLGKIGLRSLFMLNIKYIPEILMLDKIKKN